MPSASVHATVVSIPSVGGGHVGADVEQHEAAGAVRVLGHAGLDAGLAEQRRLLVAGDTADRDARPGTPQRADVTPNRPLDGTTSGSAGHRHVRAGRTARRPTSSRPMSNSIVRLALVASVANTLAAGEVPDHPGVDGAEGEVVGRPATPPSVSSHSNLVPLKYGSSTRPVRSAHEVEVAGGRELVAAGGGAPVLPDDGRGRSGRPVERSQATTVSRWLVIPIAATCVARRPGRRRRAAWPARPPRSRRRRARPSPGAGSAG